MPHWQGPQRPKILNVYMRISKAEARIVENNPHNQEPPVKKLSHMSLRPVPINTDKEIENKFLVFGPVKMR